ncbi:hypothetical protein M422DRAFT_50101 [Sphaerobolus stellatus SS14]|uniref:Uncharacterized protein n=1 Tax=Sphaerobolus stellatus (strain SS14) TaxID=990650 RepID=A0A0C9V9H2_SPHS4|nr:hypothetical protein M422DRAFT_50101 [Sphaerobolus stellatus SS14]
MTSTGVLRTHLIKFHATEYLEACQKNGWQPKGMVKELNSATSGDLDELPCLPFTKARFRKALVEWIVGFDEVSLLPFNFDSLLKPFAIDQQTLAEALLRDSCAIAHDNINTIRMSQIRCSEFLNIVEAGNKKGKWTTKSSNGQEEVVQLALVVLFRDSSNHWGSSYLSFRRFGYLRQAEWTVLEHISDVLELPFILQEQMSIQCTPMLVASMPAYESVISALESARSKPLYGYLRHMLDVGIKDMRSNYNGHHFSKLLILGIHMWNLINSFIVHR